MQELVVRKKSVFNRVMKWLLLVVLLSGIAGFGGYYYYTQYFIQKEASFTVLETSVVSTGGVESSFDATGVIQLEEGASVTISSRVAGMVTSIPLQIGQDVAKGSVVVRLDTADITLAIREGKTNVTKAESVLSKIRNSYTTNIAHTKDSLAVAEGAYVLAQHREEEGKKNNAISELERKQLAQNVLEAKVAMDNLTLTLKELTSEYSLALQEAKATVEQAKVQLALSQNQYTYYTIRSPFKGTVSAIFVASGEHVAPAQPLATVIDRTRMNMIVYVDESDIGSVKEGMSVEFTVDSLPEKVFEGTVTKIYPTPELRNGVVYYKVLVPLKKEDLLNLYTQMTTQVKVIAATKDNVVRVPNSALQWVKDKRVLYVKKGDVFEEIVPTLGMSDAAYTEITAGVNVGDVIATKITFQ